MADLELRLPRLGMSIQEATVCKWLVEEGAVVEEGQPLVLVEMEKAESELPSPTAGTIINIRAAVGETVAVGTLLAIIRTEC